MAMGAICQASPAVLRTAPAGTEAKSAFDHVKRFRIVSITDNLIEIAVAPQGIGGQPMNPSAMLASPMSPNVTPGLFCGTSPTRILCRIRNHGS